MKMPEPFLHYHMHWNQTYLPCSLDECFPNIIDNHDRDNLVALFTESQLREAVQYANNAGYAKGYDFFEDELKQLQEQNRWLDEKIASQEAVMKQALAMLRHESVFSAIEALEDALK